MIFLLLIFNVKSSLVNGMTGMTVNEETFKADKVKSLISLNVEFFFFFFQ